MTPEGSEENREKAQAQMQHVPTSGPMSITVYNDGQIKWDGFNDLYQVLGFVDIHMNPQNLKNAIVQGAQQKAQQAQQGKNAPEQREVSTDGKK